MLTTQPTAEMIEDWKKIYKKTRPSLTANRKSGNELDRFFRENFIYKTIDCPKFRTTVERNILDNAFSREKLPDGAKPDVRCYSVDDILVGIDIVSGEFNVECVNIDKAAAVYDKLYVYRGLDNKDLDNSFLVAQYVTLTGKLA